MSEFKLIVEVSPVLFVNKIIEEIENGFYVQRSMEGHPIEGYPNYIRLTATERPDERKKIDAACDKVNIGGWDMMTWLLDIQCAILQGFTTTASYPAVGSYKTITLVRKGSVAPTEELAADGPTEPPKTKAKRTPKPKIQQGE